MQAYRASFANIYNMRWSGFTNSVAPKVEQLIAANADLNDLPKTILDVCCGTGQFANAFLSKGYRVQGIDLSPHMIEYASQNNKAYVDSGQASFIVADAASFSITEPVSYATCLYDAMNHLPFIEAISSCLKRVYNSIRQKGLFVFDINTKQSLQRWAGVSVQEDDELFMLTRGVYDPSMDRAYTQITGFLREGDGKYGRFSETVFNLALSIDEMLSATKEAGFKKVYCASIDDLMVPTADPEAITRAFFICQKD
jgi:SAM-dependent methyltransferase